MPHPDAVPPPVAVRIVTVPTSRGLERYAVRDTDGLQHFPKPGTSETLIACQGYIERMGVLESTYAGFLGQSPLGGQTKNFGPATS